jgi:hypothetical protein
LHLVPCSLTARCTVQNPSLMLGTRPAWDERHGTGHRKRGPFRPTSCSAVQRGAAAPPCLFATHTPTVPLRDPLCWAFCDLTWARDGNRKFRQPRQFLIREAHCLHPSIDPIGPIDSIDTADSGPQNRRAACCAPTGRLVPHRLGRPRPPCPVPAAGGWSRHAMSPSDRLSPPRPPA